LRLRRVILFFLLLSALIPIPSVRADPGWLTGWDKRVKITIDSGDIDTALTDFPILIYLSDSSGINGEDITFVFDEVGANSLKIAVTLSDGTTECYTEIEKWDLGNEKAWIWTKISAISNVADTEVYLYYDNDHADNTNYVGAVGTNTAEVVWDDNFIAVLHLSESSGTFLDSTSNDNDATAQGTVNRGIQKIDGGVDLPGTDDYVRIETTGLLDGLSECTIEALTYLDALTSDRSILGDWGIQETSLVYYDIAPNNKWRILFRNSNNDGLGGYFGTVAPSGAWYHLGATFKQNDFIYGYEDGGETQILATNDYPIKSPNVKYWIGVDGSLGRDLDGKVDEVRLSSIARSGAYMKATYEACRDNLLDFGLEENVPLPLEAPAYLFGAGFNASSPYVILRWASNLTDINFFEVQNSTDKLSWDT